MNNLPDNVSKTQIQDLIRSTKAGDRSARLSLFQLYSPLIIAYFRQYTPSEEIVSDLLLKAFETAEEELATLHEDTEVDRWFQGIAESVRKRYDLYLGISRVGGTHIHQRIHFPDRNISERERFRRLRTVTLDAIHSAGVRVQIDEEPLSAQTLSIVIAAITDLHTRCWLMQQKRYDDLMMYAQSREPRFVREAGLRIGKISHNSPAVIDFLLNTGKIVGGAATLGAVLKGVIDAVAQATIRYEDAKQKAHDEAEKRRLENIRALNDVIRQRFEMIKEFDSIMDAEKKELLIHTLIPPASELIGTKGLQATLILSRHDKQGRKTSQDTP